MRQIRHELGMRDAREPAAAQVLAFDRLRFDLAATRVLELVAAERKVPALLLLHPSRCAAEVAEARQLAMYLMHVILQRGYEEVGRVFDRDRTTVSHACALVEDRREDSRFDAMVESLEASLKQSRVAEANRDAS